MTSAVYEERMLGCHDAGGGASFLRFVCLCLLLMLTIRSAADVLMLTTPCEGANANRRTSTRIHFAKTFYAFLLDNVGMCRHVSCTRRTRWRSRRMPGCF